MGIESRFEFNKATGTEWLCFILEHVLAPDSITINGMVTWRGACV